MTKEEILELNRKFAMKNQRIARNAALLRIGIALGLIALSFAGSFYWALSPWVPYWTTAALVGYCASVVVIWQNKGYEPTRSAHSLEAIGNAAMGYYTLAVALMAFMVAFSASGILGYFLFMK